MIMRNAGKRIGIKVYPSRSEAPFALMYLAPLLRQPEIHSVTEVAHRKPASGRRAMGL